MSNQECWRELVKRMQNPRRRWISSSSSSSPPSSLKLKFSSYSNHLQNKLALVVASSALLLIHKELYQRHDEEHENEHEHDYKNGYKEQLKRLLLNNIASNEQCHCEPLKFFQMNKLSLQSKSQQPQQQSQSARITRRSTSSLLNSRKSQSTLRSTYKIPRRRALGEGAFGTVHYAIHRRTLEPVALKKIPKRFTDSASFHREISALFYLKDHGGHPNICSLRENFEDGNHYYLVLDLVSGGEMFDHLIRMGAYSEKDAARLIGEVASALAFMHGIGMVHGDLKPENLMLSTDRVGDGVIQIVDFGCAHIDEYAQKGVDVDVNVNVNVNASTPSENTSSSSPQHAQEQQHRHVPPPLPSTVAMTGGNTPAYCPPEALRRNSMVPLQPSTDMWSLGIILYIMLTGLHPFDLNGTSSDREIEAKIRNRESPPLRNSPVTAHLSPSALDVIERCIRWEPGERITALELLDHPWVRGETAREDVLKDAVVKKLSMFQEFKTKLEAKVFKDFFTWSDGDEGDGDLVGESVSRKASLVERAFSTFDLQKKGFLTSTDFQRLNQSGDTGDAGGSSNSAGPSHPGAVTSDPDSPLSLSGFSDLLSENMKNRYFPMGHVVYNEGEVGNHMYFINSGTIEVTTKDGSCARRSQGDFFGEGALLHPKKIRSASIKCVTPVHAIEISREYFEKYLASAENGTLLSLDLKEKDKTRKRNRAKTILRLQKNLKDFDTKKGYYFFKAGEEADRLYILEEGNADVFVKDKRVFSVKAGDIFGEHSLIMGRPRNTSAVCVSDYCRVCEMKARDFYEIYNSSESIRTSLRELCLRREFQKALVQHTNKEFPSVNDLRETFDAADLDKSGSLDMDQVGSLLKSFDPSLSQGEIREVLQSLDLDESGLISFDEFKLIFGMKEKRAASI